jgi:Nitrite/Sulfite reductase ferredoxin-like half domain
MLRIQTPGGIITPDELLRLSRIAKKAALGQIEVGFRQDLLVSCHDVQREKLQQMLIDEGFWVEDTTPEHPNIVSSVVAQNIFDKTTWLRSGDYLDVLDSFDFRPRLKVNLIDPAQELIRPLTGELNFIAAASTPQFWYLVVNLPELGPHYVWDSLLDGEEIAQWVAEIERHWLSDNRPATFDALYRCTTKGFLGRTRPVQKELKLTPKPYPHHEGIYRYDDRYWVGLYMRDNLFSADFLEALCELCTETKIGRIYPTPFKTFIIRDIPKETIYQWDRLLGLFGIHSHYSSLELNWQLPDADPQALALKIELTEAFERINIRTSSLSFSIGLRTAETTSTVVVEPLSADYQIFKILHSPDFFIGNTEWAVFGESVERAHLPAQLQQLTRVYYHQLSTQKRTGLARATSGLAPQSSQVWQCRHCLTVAEKSVLTVDDACPTCDAPAEDFVEVAMAVA